MSISDYFLKQDEQRRSLMHAMHELIIKNDPTVTAAIGSMMGKEMIIYNDRGAFKYALAAVKDYMSLHLMPIYVDSKLRIRYMELLPGARFQKGCINFKDETAMPLQIVANLISDCSKIDMVAIREDYLKNKKKK
ncbi:hypothetical protein [Mucilaginibacter xinganensis]|uniref:YdhG-like domain-containing protein n=1 Tax=Mucilaginibacter xinganensis TaxID=1234841 RepID=A0A223P269_9SPHI|nr:hypothetical protein [Mucilaginibacter xinganensis]ASU36034.1 hypothetical protein MuYL_4149 [Mucilaginibacter xinganensis]